MTSVSEEDITKVINNCIDKFEKIEESLFENQLDLFESKFGEKFHKNFNELIGLVSLINFLIVFVINLEPIKKELLIKDNILVLREKILKELEKTPEKKEEYWVSQLQLIPKEELIKLLKMTLDDNNKSEETNLLSRMGIKESKLLSHLVSYFILRLYAFMDAYVQDLFMFITDSVSKKIDLFRIF